MEKRPSMERLAEIAGVQWHTIQEDVQALMLMLQADKLTQGRREDSHSAPTELLLHTPKGARR